jgi:aspartate aminotransferase-like enzyme
VTGPSPDAAPLLLMTPGPTRVPERVLRAGARPMIHHRTPEFSRELSAMMEMLGPVFGTRTRVLPVHTTGRGAMEAAVCNMFSPGDEIIACCNGKFGEMWARFAASYGLVVHRVATDWSCDIDVADIEAVLDLHPDVRAIAVAYCDTSTGVQNDVATIARLGRARNVLVLVDGVSALGGMPFAFDEWEVDFAVAASQKCLMSSPGMAFVALSDRAWAASTRATLPRNYWNFADIRDETSRPRPETPGTPPVHTILQVTEALRMIHDEGLDAVHGRHAAMADIVRHRVVAMGLELQCPALRERATTVTAIALPVGTEPPTVRDAIKARGILTAAGMGPFRACGFRIGHMGDIRPSDVERTLDTLADVLG